MTGHPFDHRFVVAQEATNDAALAELRAGRERGQWLWFVLPHLRGLGRSPTPQHDGITGSAEARAYLAHPVLGPRPHACTDALLALPTADADHVLGSLDAQKVRSSTTLFAAAAPEDPTFAAVLDRLVDRRPDSVTVSALGA